MSPHIQEEWEKLLKKAKKIVFYNIFDSRVWTFLYFIAKKIGEFAAKVY
jgi:septin family protein